MKRYILINLMLVGFMMPEFTQAQCIKEISTNPDNPVNDEFLPVVNGWWNSNYTNNSFLNTFDWRYPNQIIIDLNDDWSHPITSPGNSAYPMVNPFGSLMPDEFRYLYNNDDVTYGDFRWEDGWELLWSNLGRYPNGDDILDPSPGTLYEGENLGPYVPSPAYIPYFVLYNRYTGLMRLFASVWDDNLNQDFQQVRVTLKYSNTSVEDEKVSGLLRNVAGYDIALDQKTKVLQALSPRFNAGNTDEWFVGEFQMGYDPCACNYKGELIFRFETFETMTISMQSRSISVEEPLTENNVADHSFLNLPYEPSNNESFPGAAIYQKMEGLMKSYNDKLTKYNQEMEDYKAYENNLMIKFVDAASDMVVGGLSSVVPWYGDIAAFLTVAGGQMGLSEPDREATEPVGNYVNGQSIANGDSVTYVVVEGKNQIQIIACR